MRIIAQLSERINKNFYVFTKTQEVNVLTNLLPSYLPSTAHSSITSDASLAAVPTRSLHAFPACRSASHFSEPYWIINASSNPVISNPCCFRTFSAANTAPHFPPSLRGIGEAPLTTSLNAEYTALAQLYLLLCFFLAACSRFILLSLIGRLSKSYIRSILSHWMLPLASRYSSSTCTASTLPTNSSWVPGWVLSTTLHSMLTGQSVRTGAFR